MQDHTYTYIVYMQCVCFLSVERSLPLTGISPDNFVPFYEAWKEVYAYAMCVIPLSLSSLRGYTRHNVHLYLSSLPFLFTHSPPSVQVQQEVMGVDLLGFELEKGDKGKMAESVVAVGDQARTPYGGQNQLVLTTYR